VYFSNLAKGIEDECRNNGWNLILCNTNDLHERDIAYIQVLADKGVDGILYAMSADSTDQYVSDSLKLLDSTHIPYLMVDRKLKAICPYYVVTNHRLGGYLCTKHLLDLGHTSIACITGPPYLEDSEDRLEGYKDALLERGIPYDPSLVISGDYTLFAGMEGVKSLVGKDYTALFAFNDLTAYGSYTQLKKMGVSIPEDVSLVGYDDIFFSELLDVPLTTLHQPVYELGQEAAHRVIHWNSLEEDQKRQIVLEPHLVIRESTKGRK
jgi:LacI family transcriptional regulator